MSRFIAFEGIDGAGTTTQTRLLETYLVDAGHQVLTTREPSDGPVGALIRNALRGRLRTPDSLEELDPRAVALLFGADRLDHLQAEIRPALDQGFWVVSDRYVDSSLAYQSFYAELSWVRELNRFATLPDRTFFLDVSPQVALDRIRAARPGTDHFERLDRLEAIASRYKEIMADRGDVLILDGEAPVEEIHKRIIADLSA